MRVAQLFAMVTEALAAATDSLLSVEPAKAEAIIEADREIDDLTAEVERIVWQEIEKARVSGDGSATSYRCS